VPGQVYYMPVVVHTSVTQEVDIGFLYSNDIPVCHVRVVEEGGLGHWEGVKILLPYM